MDLTPGTVLEGKVTGIMKFGAFVSLPEGKSGLVHISEISKTYVTDVKDFLAEGQTVKVKILGTDNAGRLNLSIKKALESSEPSRAVQYAPRERVTPKSDDFEDKLKAFMADSESKMAGKKGYNEKKNSYSRKMRSRND